MHELNRHEAESLLAAGEVAHVALVSNGEPYITPVSYVVIDGDVCFRTGPGRRLDAMAYGARVCIEVTRIVEGSVRWQSVLVWGDAAIVTDENLAAEVAALLLDKYRASMTSPLAFSWASSAGTQAAATVRVKVDTLTGRASTAGFGPELRPATS